MEWKDQYKHPNWQKKRLEAMESAGYSCELCYDSDSQLHVHHKRYVKGRKLWEYDTGELSVLCNSCHELVHSEKDVLNHILAQLPVESISEIIALLSGYFQKANWVSLSDTSGLTDRIRDQYTAISGAIAAELCNRRASVGLQNITSLLEMLEQSRLQGKALFFEIGDKK